MTTSRGTATLPPQGRVDTAFQRIRGLGLAYDYWPCHRTDPHPVDTVHVEVFEPPPRDLCGCADGECDEVCLDFACWIEDGFDVCGECRTDRFEEPPEQVENLGEVRIHRLPEAARFYAGAADLDAVGLGATCTDESCSLILPVGRDGHFTSESLKTLCRISNWGLVESITFPPTTSTP